MVVFGSALANAHAGGSMTVDDSIGKDLILTGRASVVWSRFFFSWLFTKIKLLTEIPPN